MTDFTALRADADAPLAFVRAGTVAYGQAWAWQERLVTAREDDEIGDVVLLLEHPPVYTAGRRADPANLLFNEHQRRDRGIELFDVDRGGDFTYHGPGQLVAYPIIKLSRARGVADYVRALEEAGIRVAARHGVLAQRVADLTGVWVGDDKLMAIGVRVSAPGVTKHGLAINVTTQLDDFSGIIACGINDHGVCSLASLGATVDVASVTHELAEELASVFGTSATWSDAATLPAP